MTRTLEIENQLQAAELVTALQDRREELADRDPGTEAVDELLGQLEGSVAHDVLVGAD